MLYLKKRIFLGLFFVLLLCVPMASLEKKPVPEPVGRSYGAVRVSRIVSVRDGVFFFADINSWPRLIGQNIPVRIAGIEIRDTDAYSAKNLTENILQGASHIELDELRRGIYFEIIADVYADGKNLAEILKQSKLAYGFRVD